MATVAIFEYQNEPIVEPVIEPTIDPIVNDDMPLIDDELAQPDIGYVEPPLLTNDDHELLQQRFLNFVSHYQSLILAQRSVMPNAIDYTYVVEQGFTDKVEGIKYCTVIDNHLTNVVSLNSGLTKSLEQLILIEEKTPEIIDLINYKYKVLSGVMFKEINTLKYQYYSVDCDELFGDSPRIDYAGDKLLQ